MKGSGLFPSSRLLLCKVLLCGPHSRWNVEEKHIARKIRNTSLNTGHVILWGQVVLPQPFTFHICKVGLTTVLFTFCSEAKMVDSVVTLSPA